MHYGSANAQRIEDFKAGSMNVMHSGMKITDEFYSNLNDGEAQNRISTLGKNILEPLTQISIMRKENYRYSENFLNGQRINGK